MIGLTLAEVSDLAGGALSSADPAAVVTGPVVADSRRVAAGSLFVAVPGARADGHDFARPAIESGAVAVLASRAVDAPAVLVDDTVLGLGRLARGYLRTLDARVIAITGSSGKTSTKDLLAQVLARVAATIAPEGSFNTEVGVPLTVLRADASTRFLVLENSARGVGHIAYLCEIAPPQIGVVLNVGDAHLGEFGSREAVAKAKGELVEALPPDGLAVLCADDPAVAAMRSRTSARVVTFGLSPDADVRALDVRLDERARPRFRLAGAAGAADVSLSLHGAHQALNALAVAAVALEVGMGIDEVARALGEASPISRWRMEVRLSADGVVVVNDAYNANPDSMRAALAALAAMRLDEGAAGRRWAVLGEMAELGPASRQAHLDVGAAAVAAGVDRLVVVGEAAEGIADGALLAGVSASALVRVDDVHEAVSLLGTELRPGDIVLVKASRSADLQRVAERLLGTGADAGASA